MREGSVDGHLGLSVAISKRSERRPVPMGEDASLDDFFDAEPQEATSDDDETGTGADPSETAGDDLTDDARSRNRDEITVDPAVSTYDWRPDGAACAACDEVVERRWRGEVGFVCESCKKW
jgi:hypothetical protein